MNSMLQDNTPSPVSPSSRDSSLIPSTADAVYPVEELKCGGEVANNGASQINANDILGSASPEDAYSDIHLTMEDLFGEFFIVGDGSPVEPAIVDTRSMLQRFFGFCVCEDDIDLEDMKQVKLAKEMAENKVAARFSAVEKCFGKDGAAALGGQRLETFGCLKSSLPDTVNFGPCKETWLIDMPKIAPNRQTLHMDPTPFLPSENTPLKSTERMLYTTQNVVRWAYHQGTNTFMSNARVVCWSDGSVTLHVGTDIFSLQSSKESAVTMLALPAVVRKGKLGIQAMLSALEPDEHFVVEGASAASIEEAVIAESAQCRSISAENNLAFSVLTLPNINWKMTTPGRTPVEEYIMKEYNRRQKMIEQRRKEGRPMTLTEQMEIENELLQKLQTLSAEELLGQQQEEERETALRVASRQPASRRSRMERNLDLEGGNLGFSDDWKAGGGSGGSDDDNNDNDDDDDDGDGGGYEAMLEDMRRKRQREDDAADAERARRAFQHVDVEKALYNPLIAALRDLIPRLPSSSDALGSVEGTLEFLSNRAFSHTVIEKEVPLMMEEVAAECPDVDLSRVRYELNKLYH